MKPSDVVDYEHLRPQGVSRMDEPKPAARSHKLHFDGTVNIPTIAVLIAMIFGAAASGIGVYSNLSDRIQTNHSDIQLLQSQAADAADARRQSRADLKDSLRDIKESLNKLLWDRRAKESAR